MAKQKKDSVLQISSGGCDIAMAAPALERSPESATPAVLLAVVNDAPRKAERTSRFPISQTEFDRLKKEAEIPQPISRDIPENLDSNSSQGDLDEADEAAIVEIGEDDIPALAPGVLAPALLTSFTGIPNTAMRPPDSHVAVGPSHVLAAVNAKLQVYTKAGVPVVTWFTNPSTLFGAALPAGASLFDPRVAYDHFNQRWIVLFAATRSTPNGAWIMLATSKTSDPLGAYWIYALDSTKDGNTASNNWGDYPMLGFDSQALFISTNQFAFGGSYQYAKLRTLNKSQIYTGAAAQWFDHWNLNDPDAGKAFTIQPCVHFRGTGNMPAYFVNALFPGGNKLTKWTMTNPLGFWGIGGATTLVATSVPCKAYSLPPQAEQSGSLIKINTNDTRLLNAVYHHVGNTQRIWTAHNTAITWAGDTAARCAFNWYEINVPTDTVVQQNTYGAVGQHYFFPVVQTNFGRDAFIIFGRSSLNIFGELRQTGRKVTEALHNLQGSTLVKAGASAYNGGRWGDYFGICRDPSDTFRVWAIGEFAAPANQWGTWICSTKF